MAAFWSAPKCRRVVAIKSSSLRVHANPNDRGFPFPTDSGHSCLGSGFKWNLSGRFCVSLPWGCNSQTYANREEASRDNRPTRLPPFMVGSISVCTSACPAIMLWTWQGLDFDPCSHRVDRTKSGFLTNPAFPDIRRGYAELDELLSLPPDREGQFLWYYTTDSWVQHPWSKRCLWPIEVPRVSILAFVDDRLWEHLIGSKWVPRGLREQWERELFSQPVAREEFSQEVSKREREYHDSFPSRKECLKSLLSPAGPGEDVSALVSVPLDASWLRPYDFRGRRRRGRRWGLNTS